MSAPKEIRDEPAELFIFATSGDAMRAGFKIRQGCEHYQYRWMHAWWPLAGADALRGRRWSRVTVTTGTRQHWEMARDPRIHKELQVGLQYAEMDLRILPMVFLDL